MGFYIGLDLGKQSDFSALAIVEAADATRCTLRQLDRTRGRSYEKVVGDIAKLLDGTPELAGCVLAVDQTGVGLAVVDMLRERLRTRPSPETVEALTSLGVRGLTAGVRLAPITITSGHAPHADGRGGFTCPKKDLVSSMMVMLQRGHLTIDRELALLDALLAEMNAFTVRITKHANETFEASEGHKDDLVLASALACWAACNVPTSGYAGPIIHSPEPPAPEEEKLVLAPWQSALIDLGYDDADDWDDGIKSTWGR